MGDMTQLISPYGAVYAPNFNGVGAYRIWAWIGHIPLVVLPTIPRKKIKMNIFQYLPRNDGGTIG